MTKFRICVASTLATTLFVGVWPIAGHAQTLPDPVATDARTLGWMQGFPPPPDKQIRFADGSSYRYPQTRWAFNHFRELVPTRRVWRGEGPVSALPQARRDLSDVEFKTMGGDSMRWPEALTRTYADGIVVLHKGHVVAEQYFGEGAPNRPHILFSMTKSLVGTLAALLVQEGKLDPAASVARDLPEMKGTAYEDTTVRQVMDMTVGVRYSENYADPNAEVFAYARAGGMLPMPPGPTGPGTFYQFLQTLRKEGEHGQGFAYKTANAEVLAWLVARAAGQKLGDLFESRIWSKLGAEQDGYFSVDSVGVESGGGGYNATLRDIARFGEMIRLRGRFNGQQILPEAVVDDIFRGGRREDFAKAGIKTLPGWSYRNMWWIAHDAHGVIMARGIHGQSLYIDPKAEVVIARSASHPVPSNTFNDPITLPAFRAIAEFLSAK